MLTGFIPQRYDPVGAGLGQGTNAAHAGEINAYDATYSLDEQDLPRTADELGTFSGSFYVLMRMGTAVGLLLLGMYLLVNQRYPHSLLLSVLIFTQLYVADMTRNSSMTSTQILLAASFVLGVFYFPADNSSDVLNLIHPESVYA